MKTTNVSKTKPNKTKASFRSPFAPSSQEVDRACSIARGACMGLIPGNSVAKAHRVCDEP